MKAIEGFPDYFVTRDGHVYSTRPIYPKVERKKPIRLKPVCSSGYEYVTLCRSGEKVKFGIHQLVALAYIDKPSGIPPGKLLVRHLDGTRTNNVVENLAWGDCKMNLADRLDHGTMTHGERNGCSKITKEIVSVIRSRRAARERCRDISSDYGISYQEVHRIAVGLRWKHVGGAVAPRVRKTRRSF